MADQTPDLLGAKGVQVGSGNVQHNHYASAPLTWPHQVGVVPPLAGSRVPRKADQALAEAITPDGTAIVCQVLSGLGGVGKTQLAANLAHRVRADREVDLLVWCTASSREQIISTYTRAAADILGHEDPDRFLAWLSACDKQWLIVLDDLTDPDDLRGLWPPAMGNGRTVVTTRRRDAKLHGDRRELIPVGLYTPTEALIYLTARLGTDRLTEGAELAAELGHLPLALGQAAAYILDRDLDCAAYRERFAARHHRLTEQFPYDARPDDYAATIATTWSLSIEAADALEPHGAAREVLEWASLLDPNGIPIDVLAIDTETHDGLHNLRRLSLIDTVDQTVLVHGLVQRSVRDEFTSIRQVARAFQVADQLVRIWPTPEHDLALSQVLRANTNALHTNTGNVLKTSEVHAVLFCLGHSLGHAGQVTAAVDYFTELVSECQSMFARDHESTLQARSGLIRWRGEAGYKAEAARASQELLTDYLRVLGPDHPDAFTPRSNHASWRGKAGDPSGAVRAFEELLIDEARVLGPDHPHVLTTRSNIAFWQGEAGDPHGAVQALVVLLTDYLRVLGPDHPYTLTTRSNLARWRAQAGDPGALRAFEELVPDYLRVFGPDHPATLNVRCNLGNSHGALGNPAAAVHVFEELLSDCLRVLPPNHPDTIMARTNLANWRRELGDLTGAKAAYEELLIDQLQILGADHPDILALRDQLVRWRNRRKGA
ncbi:tetratricopeptide repeat protein [Phytomonospora endophytica]|uniref:NB-ARC domain-containing protein n=1 Tax=Phytomonospora endophytica TaxID=714109 RepID=A0A841FWX1_9ACTN|nr:tetratricopeptide repeat protein [Phytomonospora endophytica]MBB6038032.1 hypothetical protein [Phytomonospora endophytica]GIG68933.1 hypothetical protein Pen01_52280 [Phytomonospora endophytica]